jgi:hypothetical protein
MARFVQLQPGHIVDQQTGVSYEAMDQYNLHLYHANLTQVLYGPSAMAVWSLVRGAYLAERERDVVIDGDALDRAIKKAGC